MDIFYNNTTLVEFFEKKARERDNEIALILDNKTLSYKELNKKSNQVARAIRKKGIKEDDIIAFMLPVSFEMIVIMLGILKSGAAFLPIDAQYPDDRIQYILRDSSAKFIITTANLANKVKNYNLIINDELYLNDEVNLNLIHKPSNLAYVIYTSGSTGKPKGVMIEHKSILNTLLWRIKYYGFNESDNILHMLSIAFDGSVAVIFSALLSGAKLVILKNNEKLNIKKINNIINKNNITHCSFIPTFYKLFLEFSNGSYTNLKSITLAGERFLIGLVQQHFEKLPNVNLYNEYGVTEASITSTCYKFNSDDTKVLIGKEINNTKCYVIKSNGQLASVNEVGELVISGIGVARGYINNKTLTKEKFVYSKFIKEEKLYKTGDLGKVLPNGNIEFLNRNDNQIKLSGIRIELQEIENAILNYPMVKDVIILLKEDRNNNKYLCAFIKCIKNIETKEIKNYLKTLLPDNMIPARLIVLKEFPVTVNGKIDLEHLKNYNVEHCYNDLIDKNNDEIQNKIKEIVFENLDILIDDSKKNENILILGINSLELIQLIALIEDEFKIDLGEEILNFDQKINLDRLIEEVRNKLLNKGY